MTTLCIGLCAQLKCVQDNLESCEYQFLYWPGNNHRHVLACEGEQETQSSLLPSPCYQFIYCRARQWPTTLSNKDIGAIWVFTLNSPQSTHLVALKIMRGGFPVFQAVDVNTTSLEVDLSPLEINSL